MDSLSNNNRLSSNRPIPLANADKPIPLANGSGKDAPEVSRAPLTLGGGGGQPAPAPAPSAAPKPAPKPKPKIVVPTSGTKKVEAPVSSAGARITGVKTFFTKLHPGAIEFLDEQIGRWLEKNPQVVIKHTNIVTGDVEAKKTEPNIIITVWY